MNTTIAPYPQHARVRIGQQWGSILAVAKGERTGRNCYKVAFDDDPKNSRDAEHGDIQECHVNGLPFVTVLVDVETFAKFEAAENYVTFQTVSAKKNGKIPQARGNVILWRDNYWISTGGAYQQAKDDDHCETYDDFVLTCVEIELVVPRAEFDGEIVAPHYKNKSNYGYLLLAPEGEFVCTGVVAFVAPLPQADAAPKVNAPESLYCPNDFHILSSPGTTYDYLCPECQEEFDLETALPLSDMVRLRICEETENTVAQLEQMERENAFQEMTDDFLARAKTQQDKIDHSPRQLELF